MSIDFQQIALAKVSRHFGRRKAVSQVSFTAGRGDILGLLGPNGAGKSTLIGMMATLVTPSAGSIHYDQYESTTGGADLRARIGLLGHELHLYPELTAKANLAFFASLYGLSDDVAGALECAGLSERAEDPVSTFSRGMRQRLALERALLHQPRLVLLDEPFTGLDDRAVRIVAERLKQLAAAGAIVVLATHDLELAEGLISRMAIIRGGKLIADAPSAPELRQQYRALVEGA